MSKFSHGHGSEAMLEGAGGEPPIRQGWLRCTVYPVVGAGLLEGDERDEEGAQAGPGSIR
jgi:hypothetical protein